MTHLILADENTIEITLHGGGLVALVFVAVAFAIAAAVILG